MTADTTDTRNGVGGGRLEGFGRAGGKDSDCKGRDQLFLFMPPLAICFKKQFIL